MTPFFQQTDEVTDPLYSKISHGTDVYLTKARVLIEQMWASCGQFIDTDARERAAKHDFYAVWWELYVAYSLTKAGISLVNRTARMNFGKGRPDLLTKCPRIWIEAVMPKPGDGPDRITEPPIGEVFSVPTDGYVLRLLNALREKTAKLQHYLEDGTIPPGSIAIIAISGGRLPFRFNEQPIPSIVRAVLGVGNLTLEIDRAQKRMTGVSIEHRDHVTKKSGYKVGTDMFLQTESSHVSAILYSAADCVNHPIKPGLDFILVHNPTANVPLPDTWLPVGEQYWLRDGAVLVREKARSRLVRRTLTLFTWLLQHLRRLNKLVGSCAVSS